MWLLIALACTEKPTQEPPTSGSFRVLTYNVHGLDPLLSDYPISADERLPQIRPLLDGYEVVGIQELFGPKYQSALTPTHDYQRTYDDPADQAIYGAGLATFLQFSTEWSQIDEQQTGDYLACHGLVDAGSDCFARKGWQSVMIELAPGQKVAIYNTHHEAGSADEDQQARLEQVDQILSHIAGLPDDMPIVFTGDFNLKPSRDLDLIAIERYRQAGLISACERIGCDDERIDKILVRDGKPAIQVESRKIASEFADPNGEDLSDHLPVSATLSWHSE